MTDGQVRTILGNDAGISYVGPFGKEHTELFYWAGTFAQYQVDIVFGTDGRVVEKRFWHKGKQVPEPKP